MSRLKIVVPAETGSPSEIETLSFTQTELEELRSLSRAINHAVQPQFGIPELIRILLERCEEAGLDSGALREKE